MGTNDGGFEKRNSLAVDYTFHFLLIDNRHTQFLRLIQLRSRIRTCDDIICFFTDGAGYFSSGILDHFFGFIAGKVRKGSGQHERLARELRAALLLLTSEP